MAEPKRNWELKSAEDVAEALDWVRRRTKGAGLVLVAIGVNSIVVSKDVALGAYDAAQLVRENFQGIQQTLQRVQDQRVTRGAGKRTDVDTGGDEDEK